MDILYLLKIEQEQVLRAVEDYEDCVKLEVEPTRRFDNVKSLLVDFIELDNEFLYQEIGDLFTNAAKSIAFGASCHSKIMKLLGEIEMNLGNLRDSSEILTLVAELKMIVFQHILYQQESIIPKMREKIPTQEREDLANVFNEIKEELGKFGWSSKAGVSEGVI